MQIISLFIDVHILANFEDEYQAYAGSRDEEESRCQFRRKPVSVQVSPLAKPELTPAFPAPAFPAPAFPTPAFPGFLPGFLQRRIGQFGVTPLINECGGM